MGTATLVTGFAPYWPAWKLRSTTGGVPPVDFPTVKLRILVELNLGGSWVDVTSYVLWRDKIRITRGRRNEQGTAPPSTCALTFKNQDRRFSPRNPNGPYYGLLQRNTEMRVSLNPGSGMSKRFTGNIPEWPPKWNAPNDRSVSIEASGVLRRLEQGDAPLKSALYRATVATGPAAYWPMEDGFDATVAGSAVTGVDSLLPTVASSISWASDTTLAGSSSLPQLVSASTSWTTILNGDMKTSSTTVWTVGMWFKATMDTSPTGRTIRLAKWGETPLLADDNWELNIFHSEPTATYGWAVDDSAYILVNTGPDPFDGSWHQIVTSAQQEGPDIRVKLYVDGELLQSALTTTPDYTLKAARQIQILENPSLTVESTSVWMGHVAAWNRALTAAEVATLYDAGLGYAGELATDRFDRLLTEEGIAHAISELVVETETMGPQTPQALLTLLRECEEVNEGLIDETFDNELRLGSRTARYNQIPGLVGDYEHPTYGNQVYDVTPTDDDFALRNDWSITRTNGVTSQVQLDDGSPLSISDPPVGVGVYDDSDELNLETDFQPYYHASYRVSKGTIDELRYPSIKFALHNNPELIEQWLRCDVNSRVQVLNPPDDIGPFTVDQIAEGYTETFDQFTWEVDVNGSPAIISMVGVLDSYDGRLDCGGSTLNEDLDTTETGVDVIITDVCAWGHDDGDYVIVVDGEEMLVTAVGAVSGSWPSRTQTLTVTRSVNGIVKTHTTGKAVHVRDPIILAL